MDNYKRQNLQKFLMDKLLEINPNTSVQINRFYEILIEEGIENYLYEDFKTIEETGKLLGELISSQEAFEFDKFNLIILRNNLDVEFEDNLEEETTFFFSDAKSEKDYLDELNKSTKNE